MSRSWSSLYVDYQCFGCCPLAFDVQCWFSVYCAKCLLLYAGSEEAEQSRDNIEALKGAAMVRGCSHIFAKTGGATAVVPSLETVRGRGKAAFCARRKYLRICRC